MRILKMLNFSLKRIFSTDMLCYCEYLNFSSVFTITNTLWCAKVFFIYYYKKLNFNTVSA